MKKGTWRKVTALLLSIVLCLSCSGETVWAGTIAEGTLLESSMEKAVADNEGDREDTPEEEHSLVKSEHREATCAEEGNIEYWTCEICGKIFLDEVGTQEVVDKADCLAQVVGTYMECGYCYEESFL